MNLVGHIVRKDLRRLALPAGLWLLALGAVTAWFAGARLSPAALAAGEHFRWTGGLGALVVWGTGMQLVTTALLAAQLVIEDPVGSTDAFWPTRPIRPSRLLLAKAIAGLLLFAVAPVVVLLPIWLANGFSLGELAAAGGRLASWQGLVVLASMALAALGRNLAHFIFAGLGCVLAFALAMVAGAELASTRTLGADVVASRMFVAIGVSAAFLIAVILHQYLTRRTARSWGLVAGALVALAGIRAAWRTDLTANGPESWRTEWPAAPAGDAGAQAFRVRHAAVSLQTDQPAQVSLEGPAADATGRVLVPLGGVGVLQPAAGARIEWTLARANRWGEDAARRVAGVARRDGAVEWVLLGRGVPTEITRSAGPGTFSAEWRLLETRGRVLAEIPVHEGARGGVGSAAVRIVGWRDETENAPATLLIQERDAAGQGALGAPMPARARDAEDRWLDCYLLVDRAGSRAEFLSLAEAGSVRWHSLLVTVRQLELARPAAAAWRDGAVLVKVRFEGGRRLSQNLPSMPVVVATAEKNP